MRQLSDILIEKKRKHKSFQKIGDLLGGISGQVIGKYAANEVVPSLDFAIKWRKAFGENLIDLMYDEQPVISAEPEPKYNNTALIAELNDCRKELISCMKEKEELKKFLPVGEATELKKKVLKK